MPRHMSLQWRIVSQPDLPSSRCVLTATLPVGISVFPDIVNALLVTSIFSAGNTYTYCATRTLYGLALESRAPRVLRKCTPNGVPIFCFAIVMVFPFLSFLAVSNDSSIVLTWLVNLTTAGGEKPGRSSKALHILTWHAGIIDYIVMCVTYIFFYRACKAQGVDRKLFSYCGYFQPYGAWIALIWLLHIILFFGYSSFRPWSVDGMFSFPTCCLKRLLTRAHTGFFSTYVMVGVAPILFVFWKVLKGTRFVKPMEADLVWERPIIDA